MTDSAHETLSPEWSYLVEVDEIDSKPVEFKISPDDKEIQALLGRLGVKDLNDFTASFTLRRNNMIIHVKGRLSAKVVQDCVVSMEPVETEIRDEFEAWFADPDQAVSIAKARREKQREKGHAELPMLEESEDPEPIMDGKIDLGELAVQYLSLSINPYPHAEGVEYEHGDDQKENDPSITRKNPFAALKDWKDQLK